MDAEVPRDAGEREQDEAVQMAARWFARRDRGLTSSEAAEFRRWLATDPRHAAELARLEASWREFDLARASPVLVAMARQLDQAPPVPARKWRARWAARLAAAAAVMLTAGLMWRHQAAPDSPHSPVAQSSYHVLRSSARTIVLEDGSVAELRDDSEVQAEFSATERHVRLVRGEALFTVTKDPARPFVVSAGRTSVRAVGTVFNVRLEPKHVNILVTEGTVHVTETREAVSDVPQIPPLLVAGQRAVLARDPVDAAAPNVDVSTVAPAEIEHALAWQSTRLVFNRTPLSEAIDAFNRHAPATTSIKLVIGDAALRDRRLGGTFRAANVEAFVRLLEQSVDVRAEHRGNTIVLLAMR